MRKDFSVKDVRLIKSSPPDRGPRAGDAVILASESWSISKRGAIGFLGGCVDQDQEQYSICFNASKYRDASVVSCSGGPATIFTPAGELKPTRFKIGSWYWKFKNNVWKAHNGEDYWMETPLWKWIPKYNC